MKGPMRGRLVDMSIGLNRKYRITVEVDRDFREDYEKLKDQAIELEQENSRLQQAIDKLGTIQGIAYIAKEQLGLVDPDTIIIEPEN